MNVPTVGSVKILNSKPKLETFGLLVVFLLCASSATWWAVNIGSPLSSGTILIGMLSTLIWVMVGTGFFIHSNRKQGTLIVNPAGGTFVLNKTQHDFKELNFYRSTLVSPTFWGATGYSMQTIEIGVGRSRYKISDDIATKLFDNEQYDALVLLKETNGLTVEQNQSFSNWLERVQESREHASPNPESNKN